ncbi:uncharacterized protein MELLADRAFT_114129 [Melampsora larici-populina 98AG31]|uniref:Uncharacterized protein n=1 Tax=Melampsora larici-populina (strain 98AG31 / pathotype 3-4-7) TaxID=747676 RepID=F4SC96_MELLP|nr:uncharacterized protein MELLADRAFT_114129 [Melampsora larici-populina 98AG31]EGF97721.1 hypothetical protein MELLADRAFT_114129 [Melampsora larici-populina 98AG31]
MASAESRAIRANRRANGIVSHATNTQIQNSSIDGEDLPPDAEADVGEDSFSTGDPGGSGKINQNLNQLLNIQPNNTAEDRLIDQGLINISDSDSSELENADGEKSEDDRSRKSQAITESRDTPSNDFAESSESDDSSSSPSDSESETDDSDSSSSTDSSETSSSDSSSISSGSGSDTESSNRSNSSSSSSEEGEEDKHKKKKRKSSSHSIV